MTNVKVLIADDHEIVRDGLRNLLSTEHGVDIVAEADNGQSALELCGEHDIDLAILDINMPVLDGIKATEQIKQNYPKVKVLALTMSDDESHIRKMIQAGASGYILKNAGKEELKKAVNMIMDDQHYFSDNATKSVMMQLVKNRGKMSASDAVNITEREKEVLELIVKEHTNQEIADKLYVSVRTVDAHRRNLLQKTGARNTAGLVRFALEQGIVSQ